MTVFNNLSVMQKIARLGTAFLLATTLVACSSDGDSTPDADAETNAAGFLTGVFLDSPVAGLSWATSSGGAGKTNAAGEFQYVENDTVTFSVGSVELGSVKAASRITPFDLVGFEVSGDKPEFKDYALDFFKADASDDATKFEQGLNMLIFLQSLDTDNNARNGIAISEKVLEFFATVFTIFFNLDTRDFISTFLGFFLQLVSGDLLPREADDRPVDRDDALEHFLLQQV